MPGIREQFLRPLKKQVKLRLAGDDVDTLVQRRDRRRLRWLAVESPDRMLRFRALRNLAELLDPDSVPLFTQAIEAEAGSLPPSVVKVAAEGLGRLLRGDAGPALRRLLAPDRPASVQIAAARSLGLIGRPEDWAAVRSWAERCDGDWPLFPDERDCVVPPEREPPGTTPMTWMIQTMYADKEARWWSSKSGKWLASNLDKPRMSSDKGADKIVAQEHRHHLETKDLAPADLRRIVLHLGELSQDRDQALLQSLVDKAGAGLRRDAIQGLGIQSDPRSIPAFAGWIEAVPDDDPELAADLARAAGRLGWPDLVPALGALRDRFDDPAVRNNITWALGECGGEEAVRLLVDLVRSREEELSDDEFAWIARALKRCGVIGREAIRGSVAIARAGGGERTRVAKLAEIAGIH